MKTSQPSSKPQIELIPLRPVLTSDQPTSLDLLVKITPPAPAQSIDRPPLNLGLVIDRSGSMHGSKIDYARQAACYAVEQLLPTDRISVTIFDDRVETIVPAMPAVDKPRIIRVIRQIQERGSTALHAGWVEGGIQVGQHLHPDHLNRVILLSDGLANVGETNPDTIASDVHGLAQRGIGTTTMGVGNDYSEDLLEAMARSGDGNFYHIESPQQLPAIFQAELHGLMATCGQKVSLGIEPQTDVTVVDVLNDLDKTSYGRLKLPNLIVGNSIYIVVRLRVPAMSRESDLCGFRLAWDDPNQAGRQSLRVMLRLPVVKTSQLPDFPPNAEVQEQIALLMAARAKAEVERSLDRGDLSAAQQSIQAARVMMAAAPMFSEVSQQEIDLLADLEADLSRGDIARSRKKSFAQRYSRQRSMPSQPPSDSNQ
ncbi:MAG: hypothetical protein Kow00121_65730 [Elainellaceae cyanobacterium]